MAAQLAQIHTVKGKPRIVATGEHGIYPPRLQLSGFFRKESLLPGALDHAHACFRKGLSLRFRTGFADDRHILQGNHISRGAKRNRNAKIASLDLYSIVLARCGTFPIVGLFA